MIYYKIHNYYSWFEDDNIYINNSNTKETNIFEIISYTAGTSNNDSILKYKEWIVIQDTDKIIELNIDQMLNIIECKQREIKLNKILDDL